MGRPCFVWVTTARRPSRLVASADAPVVVGLIGTGRMGLPICARLLAAGHELAACDRRPECERGVHALGAAWVADALELATRADVLLTVLPGSPELSELMPGVLAALRPGSTWIDLTSADPRVAGPLHELAAARGVESLEAPMGGGPQAAVDGQLELFVGGSPAAVERHRPLLEAFGRVHHVGASGAGYTTKLLANLLWFAQAVAAGEALLIARQSGLDLGAVHEALTASAADSRFLREHVRGLLDGDYLDSFGLDRVCEELDAVTGLAKDLGLTAELSTRVRDVHMRALIRYGPVDGELRAVQLLEEETGTRLRLDA